MRLVILRIPRDKKNVCLFCHHDDRAVVVVSHRFAFQLYIGTSVLLQAVGFSIHYNTARKDCARLATSLDHFSAIVGKLNNSSIENDHWHEFVDPVQSIFAHLIEANFTNSVRDLLFGDRPGDGHIVEQGSTVPSTSRQITVTLRIRCSCNFFWR